MTYNKFMSAIRSAYIVFLLFFKFQSYLSCYSFSIQFFFLLVRAFFLSSKNLKYLFFALFPFVSTAFYIKANIHCKQNAHLMVTVFDLKEKEMPSYDLLQWYGFPFEMFFFLLLGNIFNARIYYFKLLNEFILNYKHRIIHIYKSVWTNLLS